MHYIYYRKANKKNKNDSRTQPKNADNNNRENKRGNRVPVGFPERKRKKREDKIMATIKNNTLIKKGEKIMDFDNGIFCTVPDDRLEGVVWIVRKADGERITFCRGHADVMFCVGELMKQRLGL